MGGARLTGERGVSPDCTIRGTVTGSASLSSVSLSALTDAPYDGEIFLTGLEEAVARFRLDETGKRGMIRSCRDLRVVLDGGAGGTLQERWDDFELDVWPGWASGRSRPRPASRWNHGVWAAVVSRAVRPGPAVLKASRYLDWVKRLPEEDPLLLEVIRLGVSADEFKTYRRDVRTGAVGLGLRIMLAKGYRLLEEITEEDMLDKLGKKGPGVDVLDAALCSIGVFDRSPLSGAARHRRQGPKKMEEMAESSGVPERFRPVTTLYLKTYASRVSDAYTTLRTRVPALAHFWRFIDECHPEVNTCSEVVPIQGREFVDHAIELSKRLQRKRGRPPVGEEEGTIGVTAHAWLTQVRTFFVDVCAWAAEEGSPFAEHAPKAVPIARKELLGVGFGKARRRQEAHITATILDLEREMPKIRAYAYARWREAEAVLADTASRTGAPSVAGTSVKTAGKRYLRHDGAPARRAHVIAFWDWALLELLVQSGLRLQEARRLTALDVIKRRMPDGRAYYMLHVAPSKYDRARVVPVGDGLGRLIAETVQHVKGFYATDHVPPCDNRDPHYRVALPRAPYLLQGRRVPGPIGTNLIGDRLRKLSLDAGAKQADGMPLVLCPHDCRRVFASEHLNNNIPVHVIQALLGHATPDTVMVYAKLYPTTLVEEYRKAMRGSYAAHHGEESLRNPTAEEWAAFERSCSMRDMGTHLCALPTGEHCPKGLVCLGCIHAQPKKSAAPVFARMLGSHERELDRAQKRGEPLGQLAAREAEVGRIRGALRRAEGLPQDVAAAIEGAARV